MKFAFITDLHYSEQTMRLAARRGDLALDLWHKAMAIIERRGDVDLLIVGGDLIDRPERLDWYTQWRDRLKREVRTPLLVVRGNHDPCWEDYMRIMTPPEMLDVGGVRFVPFALDADLPHWHSYRALSELERMKRLIDPAMFSVTVQHVTLYPPDSVPGLLYRYDNCDRIIELMHELNVKLTISGHLHYDAETFNDGRTVFMCGPALCETPFAFKIVEVDPASGKIAEELIRL